MVRFSRALGSLSPIRSGRGMRKDLFFLRVELRRSEIGNGLTGAKRHQWVRHIQCKTTITLSSATVKPAPGLRSLKK